MGHASLISSAAGINTRQKASNVCADNRSNMQNYNDKPVRSEYRILCRPGSVKTFNTL